MRLVVKARHLNEVMTEKEPVSTRSKAGVSRPKAEVEQGNKLAAQGQSR